MVDDSKPLNISRIALEMPRPNSVEKSLERMSSLFSKVGNQRLMDSAHKSINSYNEVVTKMIRQETWRMEKLESLRLSMVAQQDSLDKLLEPVRSFQEIFKELEPMLPQQDEIRKLFEPFAENQRLALSFAKQIRLPLIRDFVDPFKKHINLIPKGVWIWIKLSSKYWIVEDDEVIAYLTENRVSDTDLERYICEYYSADGWHKLGLIVEEWAKYKPIQQRYVILKDCFEILKLAQGKNINIGNVIIPTLIAQIEGLKAEVSKIPSDEFKDKIKAQLISEPHTNFKQGEKNKIIEEEILLEAIAEKISIECAVNFYRVIGELFKNSYEFDEEKRNGEIVLNINRHKIQHGDGILLDYGTEENLVRLFLYVDFIIQIIIGMASEDDQDKTKSNPET